MPPWGERRRKDYIGRHFSPDKTAVLSRGLSFSKH